MQGQSESVGSAAPGGAALGAAASAHKLAAITSDPALRVADREITFAKAIPI
jgi:hypothetical protein